VRLAADANVLLSAVLGGRARAVLDHPHVEEVLTAEATLAEVQEYASLLARKKHLSADLVLLTVATLPVTIVDSSVYARSVSEARRRIGRRDPDDIDILALALHFGLPIWSNDNDFEVAAVEWYTTADLLAKLHP
jgi:predicted nucleic acid-binding protein